MGTASWLATLLDQEMLERTSSGPIIPIIKDRLTPNDDLQEWGADKPLTSVLNGRYLLRYLLPYQVGWFRNGSNERHYVTPTPYSPEEAIAWLFLPSPRQPRPYVLLLDPQKIERKILGPRWVRLGKGIEFILPNGFPKEAVVGGWEMLVT